MIIEKLVNEEMGFEVHVSQIGAEKFSVVIYDVDSEEFLPCAKICPTLEWAMIEAGKIVSR